MTIDIRRRVVMGAAGALALGSAMALVVAAPKPRVIKVVAKKFVFVPNEIHVKQGESVELQLTAPEVPMGFSLPDFNLRAGVLPGKAASVKLTPDKTGSFTFVCDVFCGSGHEDMSGMLVVS